MKRTNVKPVERRWSRLLWVVPLAGLLALLPLAHGYWRWAKLARLHLSRLDAADEIRADLATSHLLLEEWLAGDRTISLEDLRLRFERVGDAVERWGRASEDGELQAHFAKLREAVSGYRALAQQRWLDPRSSAAGSAVDQQMDSAFQRAVASAGAVDDYVHRQVLDALEAEGWLGTVVVYGWAAIVVALSVGVVAIGRQRVRARTALEASEQRYQRLLGRDLAGSDAVAMIDLDGTIRRVNPAFERTTGYASAEIVGQNLRVVWPETVDEATWRGLWETLHRGDVWSGRLESCGKDGTRYEEEVTIAPVHDTRGQITQYVKVGRDVTRERALEQQLRHAQKLEAIGTLAGGIAHDFNNLLTAIFGYTDLAKTTLPKKHAAVSALDMVEEAARQASGVTSALMMFTRRSPSSKFPIDLRRVVADSIGLLRRMLPPSVVLVDESTGDGPVYVRGDRVQLQQVLMNLVTNARDAMPEGGRIRVSARTVPWDESALAGQAVGPVAQAAVLGVEDEGVGMSEDVRARVFEPFFTTKERGQGAGLGLAVSHGIVTDHRGRIDIDSQPGRGTRMTVTLACCEPPESGQGEAPSHRRPRGRGETILLVENDEHVRAIVASALRVQGYRVLQAGDGAAAKTALRQAGPVIRLVVLDGDLPRQRGEPCLQDILRLDSDLPVLIVTGSLTEDAPGQASDPDRVLRKPFQMGELMACVARILAQTESRRSVQT